MKSKKGPPKAKAPDSDEEDLRILGVNANPLTPPATNPWHVLAAGLSGLFRDGIICGPGRTDCLAKLVWLAALIC